MSESLKPARIARLSLLVAVGLASVSSGASAADPKKADPKKAAPAAEPKPEAAKPDEAKKPEAAKDEDAPVDSANHKLALYLSVFGGVNRHDLTQFRDDTFAYDKTYGSGLTGGVAGGVRWKSLRAGLRWQDDTTERYSTWASHLEVLYGLPMKQWEPFFGAHVGWRWMHGTEVRAIRSQLPAGTVSPPDPSAAGLSGGLDFGADYHLAHFFTIGGHGMVDVYAMSRDRADFPRTLFPPTTQDRRLPLYASEGSSLGLGLAAALRATMIFDL